ncbi:ABC transporter ATP-binding protein [Sphaerisporangium melleum]|uniref:ABC transporter ATP-binding protein n=1 Tax=Sphaerisporangium melleum TaxID=321316 RepID=A0A917RGK2_9ACTN|nr:ABC transporter ATP-binding protein [Sphaerisporangium melleum]GGL07158.1 ABC transporter ATP-binding protein [Sphaerisporangium melleum]GII68721.1 ABC transporter ATP-binding protein [Sphaerisporangium melleum]
MAVSSDVVTAEQLTKRYRGKQTPAVDGVSFEIARGETIGLLGPNGAGKTTLIKMICGVTAPTSGRIRVFDADPVRQPVLAKSHIGAMHQSGPFDMMLPAIDNLRIAARFRGLRWRDVAPWSLEVAEYLGLKDVLSQFCFQLSGGQRQRLQMVRALITIPRLLILDEPSAGLDVSGRHQVERFVTWLREEHGVTVLWTSHHIDELERNSQRVMVVDHGRVLRFAKPRELVEEFGTTHMLVTVDDPEASRAVAGWAEQAGFAATAEDTQVHVHGAQVRDVLPELSRYCQDNAVAITGISTALDSLEKVFLRMTEEAA